MRFCYYLSGYLSVEDIDYGNIFCDHAFEENCFSSVDGSFATDDRSSTCPGLFK